MVGCKKFILILMILIYQNSLFANLLNFDSSLSRQTSSITFPSSDNDNEIRGFVALENGFELEDAQTTCTYNALFPISGDIYLKGGSLYLNKDLVFNAPFNFKDAGNICGNNKTIKFSSSINNLEFADTQNQKKLNLIDQTNLGNDVNSISWSHDGKYLAAGIDNVEDNRELKIYYFDGLNLTLTAYVDLGEGKGLNVNSVSWHPTQNYFAMGKQDAGNAGAADLAIFHLNTSNGILSRTFGAEGRNVNAVAWCPQGDYLVTGTSGNPEVQIYSFLDGELSLVDESDMSANRSVQLGAVDWNSDGDYFVVGLNKDTRNERPEISIYYFDKVSQTITLTHSVNIDQQISAVSWSPNSNFVAVGLAGSSERLRIYEHNISSGAFSEKENARVGESVTVNALNWNADSSQLAVGLNTGSSELKVYSFDKDICSLQILTQLKNNQNIYSVRWSPDNTYLAFGDVAGNLSVYDFNSIEFLFNDVNLLFDTNTTFKGKVNFSGDCKLNARGNILDFDSGGKFFIDNDSTLQLSDVLLKGLGSSPEQILFGNENSELHLSNVSVFLDGEASVQKGKVCVNGPTTFVLKNHNWDIESLNIDGVTLWTDSLDSENCGNIVCDNLTLLNSGTIKSVVNGDNLTDFQDEINKLGQTITKTWHEFDSRVDSIVEDVFDLNTLAENHSNHITLFGNQLTSVESDVSGLTNNLSNLSFNLTKTWHEFDSRVEEVVSDVADLNALTESNGDDIILLGSRATSLEENVSGLTNNLSNLNLNLTKTWHEFDHLTDLLEGNFSDLITIVESCDDDITLLVDRATSLEGNVSGLTNNLSNLNLNLTKTWREFDHLTDSLTDNFSDLITIVESCDDDITLLGNRAASVEADVSGLTSEVSGLTFNLTKTWHEFDGRVDGVVCDVSDLNIVAESHSDDIILLGNRATSVEADVSGLTSEVSNLSFNLTKTWHEFDRHVGVLVDKIQTTSTYVMEEIDRNWNILNGHIIEVGGSVIGSNKYDSYGLISLDKKRGNNFTIHKDYPLNLTLSNESCLYLANEDTEFKSTDKILVSGSKNQIVVTKTLIINGELEFEPNSELIFSFGDDVNNSTIYIGSDLNLKPGCRLVFQKKGNVVFKDGTILNFNGNSEDDKSYIIFKDSVKGFIENPALHKDKSNVFFEGNGKLLIRSGAEICIKDSQHLIFGGDIEKDNIDILIDRNGILKLDGLGAMVSIHNMISNVYIAQSGTLLVGKGAIFEINSLNEVAFPGLLNSCLFEKEAILIIEKEGKIVLGKNKSDAMTNWRNEGSVVIGDGVLQYLDEPDFAGVILDRRINSGDLTILQIISHLLQRHKMLKHSTLFYDVDSNKKVRLASGVIASLGPGDIVNCENMETKFICGNNGGNSFFINLNGSRTQSFSTSREKPFWALP